MKRIICVMLCFVFVSLLICPVFSAIIGNTNYASVSVTDTDNWSGNNMNFTRRSVNGKAAVLLSSDGGHAIDASFDFKGINTSKYTELVFQLLSNGADISVNISLYGDNSNYSKKIQLQRGNETIVCIPVEYDSVNTLTIFSNSTDISYLAVSEMYFDDCHRYVYEEKFNSSSVDVSNEDAIITSYGIKMNTEGNSVSITPSFNETYTEEALYIAEVGITSNSVGQISIATDTGTTVSQEQALVNGHDTYAFLVYGAFGSITYIAQGSEEESEITFTGAKIIKAGTLYTDEYGKIESCTYKDGNIKIAGSLSGDSLTNYIGYDLLVYRVGENEELSDVLLENPYYSSVYSTMFEISIPETGHIRDYVYYLYMNTYAGMIQIGSPFIVGSEYNAYQATVTQTALDVSLANTNESTIAFSDVDAILLNAYVSQIIEREDFFNATEYIFEGETYYFNTDEINKLVKSIKFYDVLDMSVYVIYDINGYEGIGEILSILDYLSDKVDGFIFNDKRLAIQSEEDNSIEELSFIFSTATGLIKSKNPDSYVALNFNMDDSLYSDCAMYRYYFRNYGIKTIGVFLTQSMKEIEPIASRLNAALLSYGFDSSPMSGSITAYSSEEVSEYKELRSRAQELGYAFLAIYYTNFDISNSRYIRTQIVGSYDTGSIRDDNGNPTYRLLDYSDSYDTSGWTVGGSFDNALTSTSPNGGRAILLSSSTSPAIALYRFDKSLDLSNCDFGIKLYVESDDPTTNLSVIVSSAGVQKIYNISVESFSEKTYYCKLSDFGSANNIEYFAIQTLNSKKIDIYLKEVLISSENATAFESFTENEEVNNNLQLYITLAIAALTVIIFLAMLFSNKRFGKRDKF